MWDTFEAINPLRLGGPAGKPAFRLACSSEPKLGKPVKLLLLLLQSSSRGTQVLEHGGMGSMATNSDRIQAMDSFRRRQRCSE
jgi:hypothetical protein